MFNNKTLLAVAALVLLTGSPARAYFFVSSTCSNNQRMAMGQCFANLANPDCLNDKVCQNAIDTIRNSSLPVTIACDRPPDWNNASTRPFGGASVVHLPAGNPPDLTVQGVTFSLCPVLFHELTHAAQILTGYDPWGGVGMQCTGLLYTQTQSQAVECENSYRRANGLGVRSKIDIECASDWFPTGDIDKTCPAVCDPKLCYGTMTGCCHATTDPGSPVVCKDVSNDPQNCFACGSQCHPGEVCDNGLCECPGTAYPATRFQWCAAGGCVDWQNDAGNCGSCGSACSGSTPTCQDATCVGN